MAAPSTSAESDMAIEKSEEMSCWYFTPSPTDDFPKSPTDFPPSPPLPFSRSPPYFPQLSTDFLQSSTYVPRSPPRPSSPLPPPSPLSNSVVAYLGSNQSLESPLQFQHHEDIVDPMPVFKDELILWISLQLQNRRLLPQKLQEILPRRQQEWYLQSLLPQMILQMMPPLPRPLQLLRKPSQPVQQLAPQLVQQLAPHLQQALLLLQEEADLRLLQEEQCLIQEEQHLFQEEQRLLQEEQCLFQEHLLPQEEWHLLQGERHLLQEEWHRLHLLQQALLQRHRQRHLLFQQRQPLFRQRQHAQLDRLWAEVQRLRAKLTQLSRRDALRITIPLEDILQNKEINLQDAAMNLNVSRSTLKRVCRDYGIPRWPPRKNNKLVSNSLPRETLMDGDQEQIPQLSFDILPSNQASVSGDTNSVTVKAKYENEITIKFRLSSPWRRVELEQQVGRRLELKAGTYHIKYKDEENELILIACDDDLEDYISTSILMGTNSVEVFLGQK